MKVPAANQSYQSSSWRDSHIDAWSQANVDDCLGDLAESLQRTTFSYTSNEDPDPAQVWRPEPVRQQSADELEPTPVLNARPMAKKGSKKKVAAEVQPRVKDDEPEERPLDEEIYEDEAQPKERATSLYGEGDKESPPLPPVNGVSSPALSALDDDTGFDTRAWANNIPFGLSPPNAGASPMGSPSNNAANVAALGTSPSGPSFSLAGSPPVSMDRQRLSPNDEFRGTFGTMSPRTGQRLPSQHPPESPAASSPRGRPLSLPTNHLPPPPPSTRRPQAHFRGVSEAEIGMIHPQVSSEKHEGFELTLFDQAFYDGGLNDVVIVSSGRNVYVYKLDRDRITILGSLGSLRGTVISAKMLPPSGSSIIEPTIALVVHGPALVSSEGRHSHGGLDTIASKPALSQTQSQTTVEVYAIKSSKHVATLFSSPVADLGPRAWLSDPATAVGALSIQASNRFVVVTSGISGEVYIFESKQTGDEEQTFRCIGKTWTSMPVNRQRSYSVSSASSSATSSRDESPSAQNAQEMAIVSLSHRWLAVVPPPASSQNTLQGEIGVATNSAREPPGLMAHTSPAPSSANCEAETPLEEGFINKLARDAAQETMKGAKRAGEAGMQAIRNYWNKVDVQLTPDPGAHPGVYGQHANFPPTHAQENITRPGQAQTLVSMIDLERLSESNNTRPETLVQPIASFLVRAGCSFLSFGPTGLSIFTSSAKGDVSYVWCLMRMIHGNIATPQGDIAAADSHASVRQIARYSRFTTSNIVDVVWTKPTGEKLAILTERGTVHLHDIPANAFRWPPPARHTSPMSTPGVASETSSHQSQSRGRFGNAMSFVSGTAQSLQQAAKYRPSFSGTTLSGIAATAGVRGSRMVAAGFSKSMGAASGAVSNIMHMGENRIALPGNKARAVAGAVMLSTSKYQDTLAITGSGTIRLHSLRTGFTDGGKAKRTVTGEMINQLNVPKADDFGTTQLSLDGLNIRGQWFADIKAKGFNPNQPQPQPLSFAEIETSAPFRPFHSDHKVSMNTYADDNVFEREGLEDWEFGEDIETRPVAEEELPAGSMFLNKPPTHRTDPTFEETGIHDFDEGDDMLPTAHPLPVPKARSSAQEKSIGKSKRGKKTKPEPKAEDLIDMHGDEDLDDAARGRGFFESHDDDGFEDEDGAFPFGQNSEFGM